LPALVIYLTVGIYNSVGVVYIGCRLRGLFVIVCYVSVGFIWFYAMLRSVCSLRLLPVCLWFD